MKVMNKIASVTLGLVFIGSAVFAQSLADAKKAIDAEQFQKAKGMLKNLTVTQPTKDENFFYLGQVYIYQDYPDSANAAFNKGLAINPKSALNYVGLGTVDRIEKNPAAAKADFDKAISLAGKDDKPYVYIAKAYVFSKPGELKPAVPFDPASALAVLDRAKVFGAKDPDFFVAMGDAYRAQGNSSLAYTNYNQAQLLDPNSPKILVNMAVLIKNASNFDDANTQFQAALAKDPNFGPAYRELAESNYLQAKTDPKVASVKIKQAVDNYKKYLDLTDRSVESRLRYADFLVSAGDYKTLEAETNALAQTEKSNLRVYRYLAYSAYENGDYPAGLTAMNKWMKVADPKRIIPRDYLYLGRLQLKAGQDSLGINTLRGIVEQDTTQTDLYGEIASSFYGKKKYVEAGNAYKTYLSKSHNAKLIDYFREGISYYFGFLGQSSAADKNKTIKPDSSLLVKADSALSYVIQKSPKTAQAYLYRAYINDYKETDRANNYKGYSKPFYEGYINLIAPTNPTDPGIKSNLLDGYSYLGYYYEFVVKDEAKALENWTKAKELDPANKQVQSYFSRKNAGTASKGK